MSKIKNFIKNIGTNLKTTVSRFPMTLVFFALLTAIIFIMIEDYSYIDEDLLLRIMFAGIFGAFLATALKFLSERFEKLEKYTLVFYILTLVLAAGYFYFMTDDKFSNFMVIHLLVITFALFAAYLYLPSAKNTLNFGNVALAHFKAAFTSILYGIVLYLGIAAIMGAIDVLLYDIDYKAYAHAANIIFVFFTPSYYLSLLPKFNSKDEVDNHKKEISYTYPKFLDILVSYITIPLISAFTAVLVIYFVKILVTGVWPVGQVGPMVLGYSAVGYFIYILGSNLKNNFSVYYRKFFPLVLIPLVAMQMVSAYIRIEAYGFTESRYYVVLFGIFSLVCALMLLINKRKNPNTIVLLSALFALISIIPPVDAFTISKNSQQGRLVEILSKNNMLINNEIVKRSNLSDDDKYEITNISNYLHDMGYLDGISWYPAENIENYYANFKNLYGFEQYYGWDYPIDEEQVFLNATLDINEVISVEGFDLFFRINVYNNRKSSIEMSSFELSGKTYKIMQQSDDKGNLTFLIKLEENTLMEIPLMDFIDGLLEEVSGYKESISQENLTIEKQNNDIKVKLLFNSLYVDKSNPDNIYINGDVYVFAAEKQ